MRELTLIYHDVVPADDRAASGFTDPSGTHYALSVEQFEEHLEAIAHSRLNPALLESPGEPRLLLTFDDGGCSAVQTIAPMLEARGWRGHFFVVTSALGTRGFLDVAGVRALHAAGHAIGSHTHSHPNLAQLDDAGAREEWRRSKTILEDVLGSPVTSAAVPGGSYTRRTAELAFDEGYAHLFTSDPFLEPRSLGPGLLHGRFSIVSETPAEHVAALCRLSPVAIRRAQLAWQTRRAAKRALGPVYARVRGAVLARRYR